MRWVKASTLYQEFDVSVNTIKKLINDGTLKQNIHFKDFPFGRRFNTRAIEKLTVKDESVERLLDVMLQC